MLTCSPRLGTRPKRDSTRPPMVSNSSSLKLVPNAALKSAISVSALTR